VAAGSSNGCPKVSSKSSGGSIKAGRKKRGREVGEHRAQKSGERRGEEKHKRRILHV